MANKQTVIENFGDYELIFGNNDVNTLTGDGEANIFLHKDSSNDVIKNFNPSEDVIILSAGKVSESLESSNGKDVILKISDGNLNLGTITVKNTCGNFITVYDEEKIEDSKAIFREFITAYVKSAVKTFEEDEDIQSILNKGENSSVLAEIKKSNPELAKNIAESLKLSYEIGISYLDSNSNKNVLYNVPYSSDIDYINSFNDILSAVDFEATTLVELSNIEKVGVVGGATGQALSKVAGPLSVSMAFGTCILYDSMLYSENTQAWIEAGSQGDTQFQKLALIRDQNSKIFDSAAKSHVNLACSVGGLVTVSLMGAAGIVGTPIIIVAGAFCAAPFVFDWAYKKFIAKKFEDEANKFYNSMKNKFSDEIGENISNSRRDHIIDLWANNTVSTYDYFPESGKSTRRYNYQLQGNILYGTPSDDYVGIFISSTDSNGVNRIITGSGNDTVYGGYIDNLRVDVCSGNNVVRCGDTITAGNGNNFINSGKYITTGNGNNTIYVYSNYSTIKTGSGDNIIYISSDYDTIKTGSGDDFVTIYGSENSIDVEAGNDTIYVKYGTNNTVKTGAGKDSIYITNSSDNLIDAGNGNNTIYGESYGNGNNKNTIKTGLGDDFVSVSGYMNLIDAGAGNNTIHGVEGTIKTGSGNDFVSISGNDNSIDAGAGNNTIYIAYGTNNTIKTGTGDDSIFGCGLINAGEGNNTIYGEYYGNSEDKNTIKTGAGNDSIRGCGSINAGAGNNTIYGYVDNNTIKTGSGNDFVSIYGSENSIDAGNGNNTIYGGIYYNVNNNNTIKTGSGDDFVSISGSKNLIDVGAGNNIIYGFEENSTLSISSGEYSTTQSGDDLIVTVGKDKISLIGAANMNNINIAGKKVSTLSTVTDKTKSPVIVGASVKMINASSRTKSVKITGNALSNTIKGGSNKDSLYGSGGNDKIYGNSGNDYLSGDKDNDTLDGGIGNDKLFGGAGNDSINGGAGKDTLSGGIGNDKLLGGAGNDSINGGDGKDTLSGGIGDDKLFGGAGNDCLSGGKGNDTLWGNTGNDKLYGGDGKDTFIYKPGEGTDTIFDYQSGDMLKILKSNGKDGGSFINSSFKNGNLTLSINGGGKVIFDGVASGDKFNINSKTYTLSGTKLK